MDVFLSIEQHREVLKSTISNLKSPISNLQSTIYNQHSTIYNLIVPLWLKKDRHILRSGYCLKFPLFNVV